MAFTQQLSGPLLHLAARPRRHPAAFRRRASPASACADCVRRAALLSHFGSIGRLRAASAAEIAEVAGFGGRMAQELHAFLNAAG